MLDVKGYCDEMPVIVYDVDLETIHRRFETFDDTALHVVQDLDQGGRLVRV